MSVMKPKTITVTQMLPGQMPEWYKIPVEKIERVEKSPSSEHTLIYAYHSIYCVIETKDEVDSLIREALDEKS